MFEFRLPDLGEGIHEGEVLRWFVKPGDTIAEDAPLVEVETDKAAVTIPSPKGGRVVEVRATEGESVRVGEVLVVLDVGEDAGPRPPVARPRGGLADPPSRVSERRSDRGRVAAAPATRRLARELGVDLAQVPATGPGGRVTAEDVRRFAGSDGSGATRVEGAPERAGEEPISRPADAALSGPRGGLGEIPSRPEGRSDWGRVPAVQGIPYLDIEPLPDFSRWGEVAREPVRSIRRKVARNTVTAMTLIPHVAHMDEADVTDLEAFRRLENARRADGGARLTLLAFVVKAVTTALRHHPVFNASLDPFRDELITKKYYHIGIAVDTDRGLIVPNIKDADRLGVLRIAEQIEDLARRVRNGSIGVEDLLGGTFTITNIGVLGGTSFVPAIHYPESAILGMGRASPRPVVREGQVVIRTILPLTLSFDHRIADGAGAARFVGLVRDLLENPLRLAVEG